MKIAIMGERCASCDGYTQYYCYSADRILCAIDSGYCSRRSRNVRPGDRCREYRGRAKAAIAGKCESCGQYAQYYCAWMDGTPKEIGCGHCLNKGTSVQPDGSCRDWNERRIGHEEKNDSSARAAVNY